MGGDDSPPDPPTPAATPPHRPTPTPSLVDRLQRLAALRRDLDQDVDELIRQGEFEPLTADYFIDYAREKFGKLYGI